MSLRRLAAVATRGAVARCGSRAGPSSLFLGTATAPVPSRAIVPKCFRGFSAASPRNSAKPPRISDKTEKVFAKSRPPVPFSGAPAMPIPISQPERVLPAVTRASAHALHLAVENAYLNWVRNGLTATALGMAFVHFRLAKDSAEFSIGGGMLQSMGAVYVGLGSVSYLTNALFLQKELALTLLGAGWYVFNAAWPPLAYAVGMMCLLGWHPQWLLTALARNVDRLPEHWQSRCVSVIGDTTRREDARKAAANTKKAPDKW